MALDESAVSDLLDALRVGEGTDLVRELAQWALQQLIEAEATETIGADPWERSGAGSRIATGTGPGCCRPRPAICSLAIPKLRKGSFFPELLEPRRRIDQALYAVVMEAYVNGVSTRSVDDLVAAMGVDTGISKSEVSRICAGLDERVDAFRNRTLGHVAFPYVYLDATYINVRDDALGQVVSRAVVIATGHHRQRRPRGPRRRHRRQRGRDVLDPVPALAHATAGLGGVRLVISDAHAGLKAAIRKCFAGSSWQRCRVHYARNLLATVPKAHTEMVAAAFRSIFALGTAERGRRPLGRGRRHPRRPVPQGRRVDARRQDRRARVHRVPAGALAQDLVEQPARAAQQGSQAPLQRRRDLPQRRRRDPPHRRRPRRPTRRMGHRPPLPLRSLHGRAQPTTRH